MSSASFSTCAKATCVFGVAALGSLTAGVILVATDFGGCYEKVSVFSLSSFFLGSATITAYQAVKELAGYNFISQEEVFTVRKKVFVPRFANSAFKDVGFTCYLPQDLEQGKHHNSALIC